MDRGIQAVRSGGYSFESAITKLWGLSHESQAVVASVIDRLALAEGVSRDTNHKLPIENIELWITKLRSERKSAGTIFLYEYLARRFLKQISTPTKADIREYLGEAYREDLPFIGGDREESTGKPVLVPPRPRGCGLRIPWRE